MALTFNHNDKLFVSGSNVGIGTEQPVRMLHVATGDTNPAVRFENNTSNGTVLELKTNTDGKIMSFQTDHIYINGSSALHIGNNNSQIYLRSSGGTTVNGTTVFTTGGTAALSVNGTQISFGYTNSDLSYFRRLGVGKYQWQTYNNGNNGELHLQPYGGNIGIGTTTPEARLDVRGTIRGEAFQNEDSHHVRVIAPKGGSADLGSSATGAIKVTLPQSWTNTMMSFTVKVYDYSGGESFDVRIHGYNYAGGDGYWANPSAYIISQADVDRNFSVRFAHDGTKCCILIGETSSTWSYLKVAVLDFQGSHSQFTSNEWDDGWSISLATDLPDNIDANVSNTQISNWKRNGQNVYFSSGTGNVGIGTSSPGSKLYVESDTNTRAAVFGVYAAATNNKTVVIKEHDQSTLDFGAYNGDWTPSLSIQGYNNESRLWIGPRGFHDDALIRTAGNGLGIRVGGTTMDIGTNALHISSTGNVTMYQNLTVDGIVTAQEFHTEFVSASIMYDSGSTKFGDTNDDLHEFTGSLDVLMDSTAGKRSFILSGTSGPRLQRRGDTSGWAMEYGFNSNDSANQGGFGALGNGTSLTRYYIGNYGAEHVTVLNSGNVGMGTVSPVTRLHLHTENSNPTYLQFTNNTTGATANDGLTVGLNGSEDGVIFLRENNDLFFGTNDLERMRIKGGGNVGIGTASPDEKLHVAGNVKASNYYIANNIIHTGDTNTQIIFDTDKQTFQVGGSNTVTINSTGVGIFDTTPSYGLDVNSAARFTGTLYSNNTLRGNSLLIGNTTAAQPRLDGFYMQAGPETGQMMAHPYLMSDLAAFVKRGGTVTVDGLNNPPTNFDTLFRPDAEIWSTAAGNYAGDSFTIELSEVQTVVALSYGTYCGIQFGNSGWAPASLTIDWSTDNGANWTTALSSSAKSDFYYTRLNNGSAQITNIKFTIGRPASSLRILNIFATDYAGKGSSMYHLSTEGGNVYGDVTVNSSNLTVGGDVTVQGGQLYINNTDTKLEEGNGNALRVTTPSGYIEMGAMNTSHAHIYTDRPDYYFNKEIKVDSGLIGSYDENLSLRTSGTTRMTIDNSNGYVGIATTPQRVLDVKLPNSSNIGASIAGRLSVGNYQGLHFGYAEETNNLYRKSAIVFERTDLTSNNAQGKVHILNGPQAGAASATLADAKLTIAENGNVGIGTTAPTHTLHVSGTHDVVKIEGSGSADSTSLFEVHGNNGMLFAVDDDLSDSLFSVNTIAGLPVIEAFSDNRVVMGAFNQNDFVISGSRVGIGTDQPDKILQIHNPAPGGLDTYAAFTNATSGLTQQFLVGINQYEEAILWNENNKGLIIATNNSRRVTIANSGRVGIGTASPSQQLHVAGNIRAAQKLILDANDPYIQGIGGNAMRIKHTAGQTMYIRPDETGLLSIFEGSSSPQTMMLSVGTPPDNSTSRNSATLHFNTKSRKADGTTQSHGMYIKGITTDIENNRSRLDITGANAYYFDDKVGISTGSPSEKLDVEGNIKIGTASGASQSGYALKLFKTNSSSQEQLGAELFAKPYHSNTNGGDLIIKTTNTSAVSTTALVVNGEQKVGIGTTSPDTKLHLYEVSRDPVLLTLHNYQGDINPNGSQGNFIDFKMTDDNATFTPQARIGMVVQDYEGDNGMPSEGRGNFVVYTGEGSDASGAGTLTEQMRVTHQGHVGIGTASPSQKLHVVGNGRITSDLYVGSEIFHDDDYDTKIKFDTDRVRIYAGNALKFDSNNTYLTSLPSHNHDDRYLRKYTGTGASISNAGYTTVFTINGGTLASHVKFSAQGTANNVVVSTIADIICNHHMDIVVEANSGHYTRLYIKVLSNNNEDFAIQLKTNHATPVNLDLEVFTYGSESVTFTSDSDAYTGQTLEVDCEPGKVFKATGGDNGDIKTYGVFKGNGSGLTNLPWANLTGVPTTFAPSGHSHSAGDITTGTLGAARLPNDIRDGQTYIGNNSNNYIQFNTDGQGHMDFYVNGVWSARLEADGDLHVKGDVIAFSSIFNA